MKSSLGGFSDNPFMIGYDNQIFEGDEDLGFRFPQGLVIDRDYFCSLDELVERIKRNTGYPTILNMGDSSTSGWNSERTFKGNTNVHAPFFTYKTYADLTREQLFANVINAGVPGYTSLQGRKRIGVLLKTLAQQGITPDYTTMYFGNNDGTYNQYEDKVRIDYKPSSKGNGGERVSVVDFMNNMANMICTIREYGSRPILIMPLVRYVWEPGVRSRAHKDEFEDALMHVVSPLQKKILQARILYSQGQLKNAVECDVVLPRLKLRYRRALLQIARKNSVPVIDVQKKIMDDNTHFVDYCHPNERTNQIIVDEFKRIRHSDISRKRVLSVLGAITAWFDDKKNVDTSSIPTDIYTLY